MPNAAIFFNSAMASAIPWFEQFSRDCSAEVTRTIDRLAAPFAKPAAIIGGSLDKSKGAPSTSAAAAAASGAQMKRATLDLKSLNPSLSAIGMETIAALMPRYLAKAGLACERMQHLGMTLDMIRLVMRAVWSMPEGATVQSEEALRQVFRMLDSTGDGTLDEDEFLAVLPLLGETVPPEVLPRLFELVDDDRGGTVDGAEFVAFVRRANPHDEAAPEGWRAFLPEAAAHFEEMVLLHLSESAARTEGRMRIGDDGQQWRVIPFEELEFVQRSAAQPWSTSIVLARVDLANAEATVAGLRDLGFSTDEARRRRHARAPPRPALLPRLRPALLGRMQVLAVVRALFVSQTDADYAKVSGSVAIPKGPQGPVVAGNRRGLPPV